MNIWLEIFGYIGTALVLLSMMMTSMVKLRMLNLTGSVVSMIYALLIGSWPVVILNVGTTAANIVQLARISQSKKRCADI